MSKNTFVFCLGLTLVHVGAGLSQTPTGTIAGVARDPSGAAVPGAHVRLNSQATGTVRATVTSERGDFSFPSLAPGGYELSMEAAGFQRMMRQATAEAGATTSTDFALIVGETTESITVETASSQMRYDSHTVG